MLPWSHQLILSLMQGIPEHIISKPSLVQDWRQCFPNLTIKVVARHSQTHHYYYTFPPFLDLGEIQECHTSKSTRPGGRKGFETHAPEEENNTPGAGGQSDL